MHPELFKIGKWPLRTWGLTLLIGIIVGLILARRRASRFGLEPQQVTDAGFWMTIAGIIGARAAWVILEWDKEGYAMAPLRIFDFTEGGMTSFGSYLFALLALLVWCRAAKVRPIALFDLFAAPGLLAIAIGRIGCLLNGCCYGTASDLPWAVHQQGVVGLVHPAQIYETLMLTVFAIFMLVIERKQFSFQPPKYVPGTFAGMFLLFTGISRFIYEFFRAGASSETLKGTSLTLAHFFALLLFAIGASILVYTRARRAGPAA